MGAVPSYKISVTSPIDTVLYPRSPVSLSVPNYISVDETLHQRHLVLRRRGSNHLISSRLQQRDAVDPAESPLLVALTAFLTFNETKHIGAFLLTFDKWMCLH